jgi:hypothetical protein
MAGSIAEFKASFRTELARPNKFDVFIPIPVGLAPYLTVSKALNYRCESTDLPGRAIATTTQKIYGPEEKFPYQTTYNDISLTFICTDKMEEKNFFDAWLEYINPSVTFNFKYKEKYAVNLRINQYDVRNRVSYSVDLVEAFPIGINEMPLDWSSDGYHKLTVTFAYTKWRNNSVQALAMQLLETGQIPPIDSVVRGAAEGAIGISLPSTS